MIKLAGAMRRMVTDEEVREAMTNPPKNTRALEGNEKRSLVKFFLDRALQKEKEKFSPAFFEIYFDRMDSWLTSILKYLSCLFLLAIATGLPVFFGMGNVLIASCASALLLFSLGVAILQMIEDRYIRVLPYFASELGGIDTWSAGKSLLQNSRALDEIALGLSVAPLSEFASGDPLIEGEAQSSMYDAQEALHTVKSLLSAEETKQLGTEVLEDLMKLETALIIAEERGVQFSLHLRIGEGASGYEMDQRQGSYF